MLQKFRWGSYNIVLPGNEIPQWFDHVVDIECNASSFSFKLPPPVINDNFIGIACCAVFQVKLEFENLCYYPLELFIDGYRWDERGGGRLESEHMWLCYFPNFLEAEEISWEFNWLSHQVRVVFKRVGVHFVYKNGR